MQHQRTYRLGPGDLLFPAAGRLTTSPLRLVEEADEDPGLTEPNDKGRQFVHGRCRPTPPVAAVVRAADAPSPTTAPAGALKGKTSRGSRDSRKPTGTCPATGSPDRSGDARSETPVSRVRFASTTLGTPMRPGYSPAAPIFRSSRSVWATRASQRPSAICTPSRMPTTPPCRRLHEFVIVGGRPRER